MTTHPCCVECTGPPRGSDGYNEVAICDNCNRGIYWAYMSWWWERFRLRDHDQVMVGWFLKPLWPPWFQPSLHTSTSSMGANQAAIRVVTEKPPSESLAFTLFMYLLVVKTLPLQYYVESPWPMWFDVVFRAVTGLRSQTGCWITEASSPLGYYCNCTVPIHLMAGAIGPMSIILETKLLACSTALELLVVQMNVRSGVMVSLELGAWISYFSSWQSLD